MFTLVSLIGCFVLPVIVTRANSRRGERRLIITVLVPGSSYGAIVYLVTLNIIATLASVAIVSIRQ
jgi:hypothetical protein